MNTKYIARSSAGMAILFVFFLGSTVSHASTPTVSIVSISPSTSISVGTSVSFAVATTGFVDPYYSMSDAFDGGSLGSADLNSAGEFSWTPYTNDVGTHNVTITAHDTLGDTASTEVSLVVSNASTATVVTPATLAIESVSPSASITNGQTVTFYAVPTGFTGIPTYTVSDNFSGSTITTSDVNSSGEFSWTPSVSDVGAHTVVVTAIDSSGHTASSEVGLDVASATVSTPVVTSTPVVATSAATFTENLSLGSNDAQVTALQNVLIAQGDLKVAATGYYGAATEAAVKQFQSEHDIAQLGIVGPATRTVLNSLSGTGTVAVSTTSTAATATNPAVISEIQSEIQSITSSLAQIESQIASL